jgi:threonine/homoserine/homoserine lactone efflux protein
MAAIALLAGFLMAFVGSMPPTGPVAVLVLERGVQRKYREARAIAVGCALAESGYALLAASGLNVLFERAPAVEVVARVVAIGVLVGLGIHFLRFTPAPAEPAGEPQDLRGLRRAFLVGLGIAAGNPVLIITWSTSIAALYSLSGMRFDPLARAGFAVGVASGIVVWFFTMVALIRRFSDRVTLRLAERLVRGAGLMLIGMGLFFGGSMLLRALKIVG